MFPPGDLPNYYLDHYAPELLEYLMSRKANFLFVVVAPEEKTATA